MLLLVKDVRMLVIYNVIPYSELAEPHKLLSYLLQQRIVSLSSDIIAVYVHAAMKVFGSWAAELADRWDDEDLPKVRGVVDDVLERLASFATHPDIEVQERVSLLLLYSRCRHSGPYAPHCAFRSIFRRPTYFARATAGC